jgi:5,10-methylenetetrahydrofolate reductase
MKEVLLQESMHLAVVTETSSTLLMMLDLVAACVLKIYKKTLLYPTVVHLACKGTWRSQVTDILLKIRHKSQAALG